ncbi:MAG: type IV secretory system conjugative DNA transfer family protein [Methylophilaceae bacterium]
MNIAQNIAIKLSGAINALIDLLLVFSWLSLFFIIFFSILFWLVGRKLKKFAKPEYPLIAPIIRSVGGSSELVGIFSLFVLVVHSLTIFVLTEIAYIFASASTSLGFIEILHNGAFAFWKVTKVIYFPMIWGAFSGLALSLILNLKIIAQWERGSGLHDVTVLLKKFAKLDNFDPRPYFNPLLGCFIGKDDQSKPIYVPWRKIRETHIQVLGATGTGKGVIMGLISYQAAFAGEGVVWIDPKNDRYAPKLMRAAAKKSGKAFHFIDLNQNQPAQFNLLSGADRHDIEELLIAGFDLKGKGLDGDYHRSKDEDAAIKASKFVGQEGDISIPELVNKCASVDSITDQDNFWRKLQKLADLPAIKTKYGINLPCAIRDKSVIYIVGSCDNERVIMLQKMVLVRINQILKQQDRSITVAPTTKVLDEFKYLLSPVALSGLGVIRDFDTHVLLAHQSLSDLDSCAGVSRTEAEGVVLDNTAIKIIYKLGDSQHAEKLSKNSGKRRTFAEQQNKTVSEEFRSDGAWRETQEPLIDPDVLMHLPMPSDRENQANVGVLYGVGLAKLFYAGYIPVIGMRPLPVAVPEIQVTTDAEDMI